MTYDEIVRLLRHLAPEPALVAVTPDEVAELRRLGYIRHTSLSLTARGWAVLGEPCPA